MSLPAGERGSKCWGVCYRVKDQRVAPRRGAWIEITTRFAPPLISAVAPRRGAWIEIVKSTLRGVVCRCRSPQGSVDRNIQSRVDPLLEARSLPAGERGSKLFDAIIITIF